MSEEIAIWLPRENGPRKPSAIDEQGQAEFARDVIEGKWNPYCWQSSGELMSISRAAGDEKRERGTGAGGRH